jgi:hypothetical protein
VQLLHPCYTLSVLQQTVQPSCHVSYPPVSSHNQPYKPYTHTSEQAYLQVQKQLQRTCNLTLEHCKKRRRPCRRRLRIRSWRYTGKVSTSHQNQHHFNLLTTPDAEAGHRCLHRRQHRHKHQRGWNGRSLRSSRPPARTQSQRSSGICRSLHGRPSQLGSSYRGDGGGGELMAFCMVGLSWR